MRKEAKEGREEGRKEGRKIRFVEAVYNNSNEVILPLFPEFNEVEVRSFEGSLSSSQSSHV